MIAHAGIILAYEISTIAKYATASRCSSTTHTLSAATDIDDGFKVLCVLRPLGVLSERERQSVIS
ncbi:MAG: hypothetical protein ABSE80_08690 [Halobacteriota archaeon]